MAKPKIEGIYPLSFMQQTLLFHKLHVAEDQGFLQVECTMRGRLDRALWQRCWQRAVERHAAMRTSIHWKDIEKPVQVIHQKATLPVDYQDWRHLDPAERTARLAALKKEDRSLGIDLNAVPTTRVNLRQLEENVYYLLWSCHHLLLDGWSASLILKDVMSFYEAAGQDRSPVLEPLPSYRSYYKWLQGQDLTEARHFWKRELDGLQAPSLLEPGPPVPAQNGSTYQDHMVLLPETSTEEINHYLRKHRLTLNTLVQGVWALLLSRYLNADDITFGTTVSGRSSGLPNIELMAGLFTNVLPARLSIEADQNFSHWLREVQKKQLKSGAFQHISMDQILSWINWPGHLPLFDTLLVVENFPWEDVGTSHFRLEDFKGGVTTTYPLSVIVKPGRQLEFQFRYQPNQLSGSMVKCFATQLEKLLLDLPATGAVTVAALRESIELPAPIAGEMPFKDGDAGEPPHAALQIEKYSEYLAPRNALELKLAKIWEQVFGRPGIGIRDNFFEIGGRSILAVRLFAQIQEQLGRNLPPATLLEHPTIEALASSLREDTSPPTWSSLVPLKVGGQKVPLFCIHAGGGHVFFYHPLARHLDAGQPVYAMQPKGLDGLASLHNSIEEMAAHYIEEIRSIQPRGPYALLGTCFSNPVCIEMGHQLQQLGEDPPLLLIVDSIPIMAPPAPPSKPLRNLVNRIRQGDWEELKKRLRHRLTALKPNWLLSSPVPGKDLPRAVEQSVNLERVQNSLKQLYYQYQWKVYSGKLTFIRSEQSYRDDFYNNLHVSEWAKLIKGGMDVHVVPGHHNSIFQEPEVQELAKQIQACLDQACG